MKIVTDNPCLQSNASLGIDQACLSIVNEIDHQVSFYSNPSECYLCDGLFQGNLSANSNTTMVISTKYPMHMYYIDKYEVCHSTYSFKETGKYGWNFTKGSCSSIYTLSEPVSNIYLPIIEALVIAILTIMVVTLSKIIIRVIRRRRNQERFDENNDLLPPPNDAVTRTPKTSTRRKSIDAFRGIAIFLMIFVNNGGGEYVFFTHSAWNGLTLADLVLPWFAWIMGLTIVMSTRVELRVTNSRKKIILRCFRRMMILILLGLSINSRKYLYLSKLRLPGVLQLLGVSYFVCTVLEVTFMKQNPHFGRFAFLKDILDNWIQWLIVICIVLVHTLLTFLLPIPNCPKGYLGPGGYHCRGKYINCTGGAAGYIDRLVFGNHIYQKTDNLAYGTILPQDPEGLMNTISAILIVHLGMQAGRILFSHYQDNYKLIRWLLWSLLTGIIAGILCNFEKEGGIIPVNKKMMTLSFVLCTSSLAFLLYALLYFVIDYKRYWNGGGFIPAGANSILLYLGHSLLHIFPFNWKIIGVSTHGLALGINLWTTVVWLTIATILYKKDIIITVK
ncbi:heparan-alpha-glucosaminide N-acetyltransferase-like [Prorops nasuta]|uniref:heparan-alpha-glucosaminide N-acetyltransferase-like n=1 Tax=Prorops nasuta TaxID=863751 RepID=UPI0034CD4CA6